MTADLPALPEDLTAEQAEECIAGIRAAVTTGWEWIARAVNGRAWVALGYASWDAMCEDRLAGVRLALPRAERQEAVAELRAAGMSTRAIASGLGIAQSTVADDVKRLTGSGQSAEAVTSLDGRQRPATQPQRPVAKVTETTKTETLVDTSTGEVAAVRGALDAHVPDDAYVLASWRKHFGKAVGDVTNVLSFPIEQVAEKADADLLTELERAHRDLGDYITRVRKATGLRVIGGRP